jgi:hypothetical protein
MNRHTFRLFVSIAFSLTMLAATVLLVSAKSGAQCTEVSSGLQAPLGITQSNLGNLLVAETGTRVPNTGRVSILDVNGNRRTLLDGLPSGIADVGDPNGPSGLFMRGRTLYLAIGVGDVGRAGPFPGTTIPNPAPISSPIFSSVLAIHFSANFEKITSGVTLTLADQQALAGGQTVTLSDGRGQMTIEMVANFTDYTPKPLPTFAGNVALSNPYDLVAIGDQLYVTDGGQNLVWQVDIPTGAVSTLATFSNIANPFFPAIGGPFEEAVPTGIAYSGGQLLVALFRGVPFAPGTSVVEQVDPATGSHSTFIAGLKTAIDVLALGEGTEYLVLQHASTGPFFGGPGLVLRFASPGGPPTVVANCLTRPTAMTLDNKTGTLYVIELGGRLVSIPVTP